MKKLPILAELYSILFICLVIPLGVVIRRNANHILRYSENEIASSALDSLTSVQSVNEAILQNIKKEAIYLVKSNEMKNISPIRNLTASLSNTENFAKLRALEQLLDQKIYSNDKIYSIYVCLDGADYVLSSRQGTVPLNSFEDGGLIRSYRKGRFSSLGGTWVPRKIRGANACDTISYVYGMTSLTTTVKGVLIVNLNEEAFSNFISKSTSGAVNVGTVCIADQNGNVVIHGGSSRFLQNMSGDAFIQKISGSKDKRGNFILSDGGGKHLYVYSKDYSRGWTYIGCYPFSALMQQIDHINRTSALLLAVITAISMLIAFFLLTRLSKPLTAVVQALKSRKDLTLGNTKNEMMLVQTAFQQLAKQQNDLNDILKRKEENAKELFINDLLKGNSAAYQRKAENVQKVFPYPGFIVLVVSIDHMDAFINRFTPEQRYYYRIMILTRYRETLNADFISRGVLYSDQTVVMILNIRNYDCKKTPETIRDITQKFQAEIKNELHLTVSIGIGEIHSGLPGIRESFSEAEEASKQRILTGPESLVFHRDRVPGNGLYFYPYDTERHIINCLQTQNLEALEKNISDMDQDIRNTEGISYDNIIQIFNQLISTTIKYLAANSINIRSLFGNIDTVYRKMMSFDTLDDMEKYLVSFYKKIISCFSNRQSGESTRHIDRILRYLNANYKTEINFEEMAQSVGISYSYARKLVKEETGKSLLDYTNILRIKEAKRLIRQTDQSMNEIAKTVGYSNVQSLTRFFKKYEGIPPADYKSCHHPAEQNDT